jgi:tetratricopeptide (TPR) repeat protein
VVSLADAQRSAGRFAEADQTYQRLSAGIEHLGLERTGFAAVFYNNWGLNLVSLGQPARAATLFERALDYEKGLSAPSMVRRVNYATALLPLDKAGEARPMMEQAYADAVRGSNPVNLSMVRVALAATYRELGELTRAEQLLRATETDLGKLLPAGHEAFGAVHLNKALLAQKRQDYATALNEADAAIAVFSAKPGLAHRAATTRITRAEILLALGRIDDARAQAQESMAALQKIMLPGVKSLHVGRVQLAIAQIAAQAGATAAARPAARQAYEHLAATVGANHPFAIAAHDLAGDR